MNKIRLAVLIALTVCVSSFITIIMLRAYEAHVVNVVKNDINFAEKDLLVKRILVAPIKAKDAANIASSPCSRESSYMECIDRSVDGYIANYPKEAEKYNKSLDDQYFIIRSKILDSFISKSLKDLLMEDVDNSDMSHRANVHFFDGYKDTYKNTVRMYAIQARGTI